MRFLILFLLPTLTIFGAQPALRPFIDSLEFKNDLKEVRMSTLDTLPTVVPVSSVEYPPELRGTGVVGLVGVTASIKEDGSIHWVMVTHGNDVHFRDPVQRAVQGWRFSIPRKNKKPVAAYVRFRVTITEAGQIEVTLERKEQPTPPAPIAGIVATPSGTGAVSPPAAAHP